MRNKRKRNYHSFDGQEDINPLSSLSNLSDVMLVLAVGMMLALVLHFNVPISSGETTEPQQESAVEFTDDDLEQAETLPENLEKAGEVYYDPDTGTYYILDEAP